MKYTNTHHIKILLQNSAIIAEVHNKLQQLAQLNQAVASLLPPTLAKNCSVANLRDGVLILATNSPAWKHNIKFASMDLLEQLRASNKAWAGIGSIEVIIDYLIADLDQYQNNHDDNSNHVSISCETAELINNIADQIDYEPLAIGLKRLINKIKAT